MPDTYAELLEATIQHLEGLKSRGVRFVPASMESLEELQRAPVARSRCVESSAPVAPSAPAHFPAKPAATSKQAAMEEIMRRATSCVRCSHLAASRKKVVFGVGNLDADLMFIGEAPGASEDAQGLPFVGPAGELLTKIIEAMGLNRNAVYIANILKCRPDTPGQTSGNRKPTPEEMQTCIPYLHEQIDLIKPKVLVGLGATAVEGLLGVSEGITKLRGNWKSYRDIPLMPTFHPSYLLHSPLMAIKRQVWEDMMQVMEKLQMPISEKQKKFFLGK
jgi:uracil-DNA glycosylase family 4